MDSTRRAEEVISDLFVALKTCQQEYGNESRKVASDSDSRVRQLLDSWFALFSHGLSPTLCRSQFPSAWIIISNFISSDEIVRFNSYDNEDHRLSAWLRHTMNDRVFDKYLRILLSNRSLLQKFYEPWSAICLLSADPSALIQLTSGCLATILFSFSTPEVSSTMPMAVPARSTAQAAVSASSYNDVLSAWAAGSSDVNLEDDAIRASGEPSNIQQLGNSFEVDRLMPIAPVNPATGETLPPLAFANVNEFRQSSSRQSTYNSPSQSAVLNENSDSSASESVGKLSTGSGIVPASVQKETPARVVGSERDARSTVSLPFVLSNAKPVIKPVSREANDEYSYTELKQLLLNVLQEKQSFEKSNRELEAKVTEYRDRLVELESNVEALRRRETDLIAAHQLRISTACKENEILKQQLKKYIAQLQNQGRGNASLQQNGIDDNGNGSIAERKMLELSEMHGELLEFVERLQANLRAKDAKLTRYRRQLTALRGPLPPESDEESGATDEAGAFRTTARGSRSSDAASKNTRQDLPSSMPGQSSSQQLVHVWVPLVFLKAAGHPHHIYQIYLRLRDDEWNVFRRYSELYSFHQALKRRYPNAVGKIPFPPKKSVGNRKPEFVELRRQALQTYLRTTLDLLTKLQPEFARLTRAKLLLLLPFLDERHQPSPSASGIGVIGAASPGNSLISSSPGNIVGTPRDTGRTYAGL